jgi:hypothetical protein
MRRLKQTLLAGGVVYPAGTREDDIEVAVQRDDVWDDTDIDVPESVREVDESDHPVTVELREVCEYLIESHLADKETPVSELLKAASEVFGDDENPDGTTEVFGQLPAEDGGSEPDGDDETGAVPPAPPAYADQSPADLKAEAERRDLQVDGSGANGRVVKDDLVKALEADDAAKG